MSLIVTGSIGIDSVEAPTGVAEDVLGGSTVYFAAAASFFGKVRIVGAVGEDFPPQFLETFKHFDIDTRGLEKRAGSKTFRWRGKYHQNMNTRDTIQVQLNVLAEALPPVPREFRDSRFIFLANTDPGSQMQLLSNFPSSTLSVADTMDLWIQTQRDKLGELFTKLDGLVLNDSEAFMLTEDSNLIRAAEKIVKMGPKFVVIKKGEHGSILMHRQGVASLPAFPARDVIDPTGAGDAFAGGFMGYLAAHCADNTPTDNIPLHALRTAMAYGTVVASFTIESFSLDRMKQLRRGDIDRRFEHYRQMMRVGAE